jgi:hypothetical protein
MNDDCVGGRPRQRSGMEKAGPGVQYTTKDFQLEVLAKLGEMQNLTESLEEAWGKKLEAVREQRLLKLPPVECHLRAGLSGILLWIPAGA